MNTSATLANSMMLVLLIGATDSVAGALATLLIFAVVVGIYGLCMAPLRSRLSNESLLPVSLVLAATLAGSADIVLQRGALQWHQLISLYAGLIGLQCVVLEHNGFFRRSVRNRLKLCGLFAALMIVLAVLRELIGQGSIGHHLSEHWQGLILFGDGLHFATLAPGAFILLGLLLAARQAWARPSDLPEETHHP
ncbi:MULTISPECIES: Rnf-Nqr domain containing protein [unclassified Pseudomonas]|uniref:Rnf-Nqr domain containing protein n=1 Tax=unclassified Pseudomonas TaxID=196821 RepID=UPI000A1DE9C3|nr:MULTISPECIES: Rnf-Nqr domain containing protein [unclassified Pseudomonas]MCH4898585.1 NADH:quinone oxidoreductase [Pseudomonas sp. B707]PNB48479.1 NADH:quinone oxidoreductase [Pseudomonas sp. GW456-12-10-14-LB2]TEA63261.1 NADH:quinone oxidoreductase [Pseudomonas sp. CH235]